MLRYLVCALTLLLASPCFGDTCGNCAGKRTLGTGPVKFVCPICEGTGEVANAGSTIPAPSAGSVAELNAGGVQPDSARAPASGVITADQQPAPMSAVAAGLRLLDLKPTDTLADLGCGFDCRWGITAARLYGCRVVAVEIDPATADSARRYVEHAGLSHLVTVVTGDATLIDVKANKAAAYLWPDVLAKLDARKYDRFVSFAHAIPNAQRQGDLYVYAKPTAAAVMQAFREPNVAYYGGRQYSRPVCNSRNCSMCNQIRWQLSH